MATTYFVQYTYVEDMVTRRQAHRAEHLARLTSPQDDVQLLLAGAFANPVDGAVLAVRADSAADVERWVRADAYFSAGLITDFVVRELTLVPIGGDRAA